MTDTSETREATLQHHIKSGKEPLNNLISMIFVGDLATPDAFTSKSLERELKVHSNIFSGRRMICNFEGLVQDSGLSNLNEPLLSNHSSIVQALKQEYQPVMCLANNHIHDMPWQFEHTIGLFNQNRILYCGAGKTIDEAEAPVFFYEEGTKVALFNFCWDFLLYNHKNPRWGIYVAEINGKELVQRIHKFKETEPECNIVIYFHWSLDLEILPFPMYRQLAHDLIDVGANLIVGTHSHCVQGGEAYNSGYIIYGLGNFFIPHNHYINGKLTYPEFASIELAFEWSPMKNVPICHWFQYVNIGSDHRLIHLGSDAFNGSARLDKYSLYRDLSDKEYVIYFKRNRRKKILIPVYYDYERVLITKIMTIILKMRARLARFLAKYGLRSWIH